MNEIAYAVGSYLLLITLFFLIRYITGEKRYERRERKCLFCSSIAFVASLSLALIQIYLLPAHPMPQLVMAIFIVLYVLLVEKRDLKSLGYLLRI